MGQRAQVVGIYVIKNLILLYACFHPSLMHDTPIHIVTFCWRNFLPYLTVKTILKYYVVCLRIRTNDPSTIFDQLPTDHLHNLHRRVIATILVRLDNNGKCRIVKQILFHAVGRLQLLDLFNLNSNHFGLKVSRREYALLHQTLSKPLECSKFDWRLICCECSFGWASTLHSLRVHTI